MERNLKSKLKDRKVERKKRNKYEGINMKI